MCFGRRKKSQSETVDNTEQKFQIVVGIIKDLPRADYNRLKESMDLVYAGYQKMRNVKTKDEKETVEIDSIAKSLEETEL